MLIHLKLTNFRKHRDLSLDFGPGLTVLRSENEGGKTTITESLAYALFGARSLRTSIDDTVTWHENVRTLKVEATVEFLGEVYTFVRSKSGAEVLKDGQVYVTGQTEVTNFAAKLIGADATTASNLMMASQNNLRGALEQGSKATSELVEGLAEFDFFDHLLERMQERLVLGSDVSARQRLDDAQEKLDTMTAERPDTSEWERIVQKAPEVLEQLQTLIDDKLQPAYDTARQALDQAKNNRSTFDLLNNNLTKVYGQLEEAQTQRIAAQSRAVPVDTSPIKDLQATLDGVTDRVAQRKVFDELVKLNTKYPEVSWEGDAASLQAEVARTETEIEALNTQLADCNQRKTEFEQKAKELSSSIQKDDHCRTCGQLLQDHAEIAKRNQELESQIETCRNSLDLIGQEKEPLQAQLAERKSDLVDLKAVFSFASPFDNFIRTNAQYVVVDDQSVPAKITWKGPEPLAEDADPSEIRKQISDIQQADKASKEAAARATALAETILGYEAQVADLTEQIQAYDVVNLDAFQQASNDAYQDLFGTQQQIKRLEAEVQQAKHQIELANQSFEQQKAVIAEMQERVTSCRKEIEDLGFNNALLRKVRGARPEVTNKLWNMVLAAVSTMFTQMRGEESIVTKDKDGFKVNGEEVTSFSGSTLDLLGLAIRCALTKTFLPSVSFLSLDEPAAACSEDRTSKMLGFLQTTGFAQTLLITHEDVSSNICDNLVTI